VQFFILCIDPLLRNLNKNKRIEEVKIRRKNAKNEKSTLKVQLMQMILVLSVKKALNAYNKSSMNTKDLQKDQVWNLMLTRLKF
jgi:hypothetical protein